MAQILESLRYVGAKLLIFRDNRIHLAPGNRPLKALQNGRLETREVQGRALLDFGAGVLYVLRRFRFWDWAKDGRVNVCRDDTVAPSCPIDDHKHCPSSGD